MTSTTTTFTTTPVPPTTSTTGSTTTTEPPLDEHDGLDDDDDHVSLLEHPAAKNSYLPWVVDPGDEKDPLSCRARTRARDGAGVLW
jgi:hypothetical protein